MTSYETQKGDILADVDSVYQVGVADGTAAQQAADAPIIAGLNATVTQVKADDVLDRTTIAALEAKIAELQQSNTTPPTNPSGYGGTTGWGKATVIDLTTAPKGTTYTTGKRAQTDSSTNRQAQAKFGPDGLTITPARAGDTIFSADVLLAGVVLTAPWALEADIDMQGLGPGMGPAFWARGVNGSGEIDFMEYLGSNAGKGIKGGKGTYESKATLINTGPSSAYNQGQDANGIPPGADGSYEGLRRYRAELTDAGFSEWVDGELVWSETVAAFEKSAKAGMFSQFAAGTKFYPRLTFQVGNGTKSKLWGVVPPAWQTSTIRLGALRVYARA